MISFTVFGSVPSLKNSNGMNRLGQRFDNKAVKAYKQDFFLQVPARYRNLHLGSKERILKLQVALFHDSWRRDADIAIIADCLQTAGVINNDRWIRIIEVNATRIDKDKPRAYIVIQELSLVEVSTGQPD